MDANNVSQLNRHANLLTLTESNYKILGSGSFTRFLAREHAGMRV